MPTASHRRPRRMQPTVAVTIAAALAAAIVAVTTLTLPGQPAAPPIAPPIAQLRPVSVERPDGAGDRATPDWARVLRRLDHAREVAWAAGDAAGLSQVFAAGSLALALDRQHLGAYTRNGFTARGVRVGFRLTRVVDQATDRAWLRVADRRATVVAVDPGGAHRVITAGRRSIHTVVLVNTPTGWRISRILAGSRHGIAASPRGQPPPGH